MSYKMIAIDLDGTLLNSKKLISDENINAIHYAMDRGVKVIICSGRVFAGARVFAKQLSLKEPIIGCNGAIIKDNCTEEILYRNYMTNEDCNKVIDICKNEGIYFHVFIGDTMVTEKLEFSSLYYWEKNKTLPLADRIDIKLVKSMKDFFQNEYSNILKMIVISEDRQCLLRARQKVEEIKTVSVTSSDSNNFEVVNYGVDKGNALEFLAERLNISKQEIIAIGDNENDCGMIKFAGLKVAMGNATESVKGIADYIALSNEKNGVAETIRKFII